MLNSGCYIAKLDTPFIALDHRLKYNMSVQNENQFVEICFR